MDIHLFYSSSPLVERCWAFVVWVCASQRIPLFWHETQTKSLCTRFPMRLEEDEGRKVPELNISNQSIEVRESWRSRKASARICGHRGRVGQSEMMSQRSWWLCGNFARVHVHTSPQMHRKLRKGVTNFSLLALGANSSLCLFVLLVVYVVFCVFVKKCEIPLAGDERNCPAIWWPWVI